MSNFYALIMAGGSGTRLWPLSRFHRPKQALQLVGQRTMFQHAVDRLSGLLPVERILVATAQEYVPTLSAQVPEIPQANFIVEPLARGTAGAIGLTTVHLLHRDPEATMVVLTADHFIRDVPRFRSALLAAADQAAKGHVVTLGIRPTFPSTGFGYIRRRGAARECLGFEAFEVETFVEKPNLATAQEMLSTGLSSWNSGMFIWRAARIMVEFRRQMPALSQQLDTIAASIGTPDYDKVIAEIWPQVRKETIDYGVMEHCPNVLVIPVDFGWTDVGDWEAVYQIGEHDAQENQVVGADVVTIDSRGILVQHDPPGKNGDKVKLVATIGVDDIAVIDTEDALLICARDRAQEVRALVDELRARKMDAYL